MAQPESKNIKLTVSYDGAGFHGFQRQEGDIRTVQGEIERALRELTGEDIETAGAARTDAGVHALGQALSFRAAIKIPPDRVAPALGPLLPEDLRTVSSEEAPPDFNARFSAAGKEYHYVFYHSPAPIPFLRRHALHLKRRPDAEAMRAAAAHIVGEKDFSCFRNEGSAPSSPVRTIFSASVEENGCFIIMKVHGSGFLYKMVRNIAGTLLEAGEGKRAAGDISALIEAKDRALAGPTLPPQGLYLMKVFYN